MIIFQALLGLVVGAVINQLADVLPYRHKQLSGAVCPGCGQPRSFSQASAVIAFISRRRACPACGRVMPLRNLLVELALAALFALLYTQFAANLLFLALASVHTSVLLLLTVTDFEHRLIPNRAVLPAIVFAAITSPLRFGPGWYLALAGGAIGFVFFWLAAVVGGKLIGRGAMGAGDVKLAAYIGLITSFPGILTALVLTILAGGLISLVLLVIRVVNLRSGIPYGPFIALGGFITMVWGQQIMTGFFFGA